MKEEVHIGQKRIIILGTVHAHQKSIELVRKTILDVRPDYVAVELDPERLEALESEGMKSRGINDLFKLGFRGAVISMLISYSNRKKAKRVGVPIMSDMLEAVRTAREIQTKVELIDTAQPSFDIPFLEFVKLIFFLIKNSMRGI